MPVRKRWRVFGDLIDIPAWYVRAAASGVIGRHRRVLLAPSGKTSNRALIRQWRAHFTVIENPLSVFLLLPFAWLPGIGYGLWNWQSWRATGANGQALRGGLAQLRSEAMYVEKHGNLKTLDLSEELSNAGRAAMRKSGLADGDWWVTLHVREASYHHDVNNLHRNADIATHFAAAEAIVQRGGWVIRVGDPSMKPLPPMDRVLDYVHTDAYCDWMDLYLAARCRFALGVSSGPCTLPVLYGRPMVCTNLIPLGPLAVTKNTLVIPKLAWLNKEQRFMRTSEVLASPVGVAYFHDMFVKNGVTVVDNTPEEIQELTKEMLDGLDGAIRYASDDEQTQRRFKELWSPYVTPDLWRGCNRLGRDFARAHPFVCE
jgi:putative glycosyltransferase (TIGR04372 family)